MNPPFGSRMKRSRISRNADAPEGLGEIDAADRGQPSKVTVSVTKETEIPENDLSRPQYQRFHENDEPFEVDLPPPVWRRRYQFMKWSLIFCGFNVQAIIAYGIWNGVTDNPFLVQIGLGLLFVASGIIGAYVFGATWDDKSMRDAIANIKTGGRSSSSNSFKWVR